MMRRMPFETVPRDAAAQSIAPTGRRVAPALARANAEVSV